ncbi:MAG: M24 family metallopeptidase [candidate division Zixibacteria bacterium]|nr:M24 family metallopeptidase [candidate division Zixibacteria bacterium]
MDIEKIQQSLRDQELDGWLLADFHGRNNIAVDILGLTGIVTRRSFYFIPAQGTPTGLVAPIEKEKFKHLPGKLVNFFGYKALERELETLLFECNRVAMEYSPKGRLPYIGLVDAGTIELVRGVGVEVVSSADLVAGFSARLSTEQVASHHRAAGNLIKIKDKAFDFIAKSLESGQLITEYDVTRFILDRFEEKGMTTKFPPNCSVDANAGNPHYEPDSDSSTVIAKGQLVLIDQWAKEDTAEGIYGDMTWMAFTGSKEEIPPKYVEMFAVLAKARDAAVAFIEKNISDRPVYGCDVDDVCRQVVEDAGYGAYFTHRTGHSITTAEHGSGPNIDNLETKDRRALQEGHLFSIEPGIYMNDCGFRTEINVLITSKGCEVTTLPLQYEILPLC